MANVVKLKRGSGSDPSASDMVVGEPVIRTDTAELFFKKDDGSVAKVSGGGGGPDFKYLALRNAANNGAASYPNADFTLVTSGTTNAITPAAANTLLVSVNGVIQKPNTGTSTPSSGFALNGSTIKFGGNISAAPDFILYQESGGIGEPSDETVSEAKLQVSNSPVNGYFLSAQSGNTGGLTWAAPVATSCTGNSATATALATARAINGVNFDGTAAITVTAAAGTLSGNTLNSSVVTSSLTSLGDLAGLTVNGDMSLTGANYNVLWDKSDNALEFADNAKAVFGTGSDLKIYHDGTRNIIEGAGQLRLCGTTNVLLRASTFGDVGLNYIVDGGVELFYDNSKKFETKSYGALVTGYISANPTSGNLGFHAGDNTKMTFGAGDDLQIYHNGSHSYLDNSTGDLNLRTTGSGVDVMITAVDDIILTAGDDVEIKVQGSENAIKCFGNGSVQLFYDNSTKFETTAHGASITGKLDLSSDLDMGDNDFIKLGDGDDLTISHDATNSTIHNQTGNLRVRNAGEFQVTKSSTENMLIAKPDGAVELYHDNSKKFNTLADGVHVHGQIQLNDNGKLNIGDSDDLQIYHDGNDSFIDDAGTGSLLLRTLNNSTVVIKNSSANMARFLGGDAVELYHNNSKKFETTSNGVHITGDLRLNDNEEIYLGASTDFQLFHDPSVGNIIKSAFCNLVIKDTSGTTGAIFKNSGAVELNHNGSKKFETHSTGVQVTGDCLISENIKVNDNKKLIAGSGNDLQIKHNGTDNIIDSVNGDLLFAHSNSNKVQLTGGAFKPATNGNIDLGEPNFRWQNIYTNDLNLSNEGGSNDVDGTWGSYTIQEGAEDLFLVNKRSGKKYKFNLTEVS